MRDELEQKLEKEFNFMMRNLDDTSTLYQRYGCECGDGWYFLIRDMCV